MSSARGRTATDALAAIMIAVGTALRHRLTPAVFPGRDPGTVAVREAPVNTALHDPTVFAQDLFDGLPRRYDALAEVLSFAQNRRWRAEMVSHIAAAHPRRSSTSRPVRRAWPSPSSATRAHASRDRRDPGDARPRCERINARRCRRAGADPARRGASRAAAVPRGNVRGADLHVLDALRADPTATLRELARVVAPGGTIASLEFACPRVASGDRSGGCTRASCSGCRLRHGRT